MSTLFNDKNVEEVSVINLMIDSENFTEENIVHRRELSQVKELISRQIPSDLNGLVDDRHIEGIYKTILVQGGRGSGKTTFLKNFFNKNLEQDILKELEILPFLDPTRIEDKSSIFLTIISLMRERVYDRLYTEVNESVAVYKKKSWNDKLSLLSQGLPAIDDSPKSPYYWDDDFLIMEKGLSATKSAFDLRKNFSLLVKESLELLGKRAFLLIVDDVDTDCKKAWKLLETLRKYLCIQGMITVVSGDLDLFSIEVRQELSSRFKDLENTYVKRKQITELTDQYIRKILPPVYRVILREIGYDKKDVFGAIRNFDRPDILIKYANFDGQVFQVELLRFVETIFNTLGIKNKYELTAYKDFVFNLPLRSQIDFYRVFQRFALIDSDNEINFFPLDVRDITGLFLEDLLQQGLDEKLLVERSRAICSVILMFLSKKKDGKDIFNDYYQLQPVSLDHSLNSVLFVLGLILSKLIYENPIYIFDYVIRVGIVRNFTQLIKGKYSTHGGYVFSLLDMKDYAALDSDIDLRHSMCVMTAYLRSTISTISGVVKLSKKDKNKLFEQKHENLIGGCIAQIPYSCSRRGELETGEQVDVHEYSIYNLLASIFDIVRATDAGEPFEDILVKIRQPREYLMVSDSSGVFTEVGSEIVTDDRFFAEKFRASDFSDFDAELMQWVGFIKRLKRYIPSYVLAKITTRMYYAYSNVELVNSQKKLYISDLMQKYILLMFNSVIIEEIGEHNPSSGSFMHNRVMINRENSLEAFFENLEIVNSFPVEELPLCAIFFTCPFFCFLLIFLIQMLEELYSFVTKLQNINF